VELATPWTTGRCEPCRGCLIASSRLSCYLHSRLCRELKPPSVNVCLSTQEPGASDVTVNNLAPEVDEATLAEAFANCGRVLSATVWRDQMTGQRCVRDRVPVSGAYDDLRGALLDASIVDASLGKRTRLPALVCLLTQLPVYAAWGTAWSSSVPSPRRTKQWRCLAAGCCAIARWTCVLLRAPDLEAQLQAAKVHSSSRLASATRVRVPTSTSRVSRRARQTSDCATCSPPSAPFLTAAYCTRKAAPRALCCATPLSRRLLQRSRR